MARKLSDSDKAEIQQAIADMVEKGIVVARLDDDGYLVYGLTKHIAEADLPKYNLSAQAVRDLQGLGLDKEAT